MTLATADITGIVLAGGQGRRMGNVDKGLVELDGRPLIAHVIARLAPQVATIVINANRNAERYAAFDERPIDIAVARTFDQPHPVFALARRSLLPHLARFLESGGRKIDAWYASLPVAEVKFDDEADAFRNINTPAELAQSAPTY